MRRQWLRPVSHALIVALFHVAGVHLLQGAAFAVFAAGILCVLVPMARARWVSASLPISYASVYCAVLFDIDTGFSPSVLVYLVPMIFLVRRAPSWAGAFGYGLWIDTLVSVGALEWLSEAATVFYGSAKPVALAFSLAVSMVLGLRCGVFMVVAYHMRGRGPAGVVVPLAYIVLEYWTYFPFMVPMAFATASTPVMFQAVDLVGMSGLSALLALINGVAFTLVDALVQRRWGMAAVGATVTAGLLALLFGYGIFGMKHYVSGPEEPAIRVATIQPMSPLRILNADKPTKRAVANELARMSREAITSATERPVLLVWPEGAAPFAYLTPAFNPEFVGVIQSLQRDSPVAMVFQDIEFVPGDEVRKVRYYSHISSIGPDGTYLDGYRKNILMPFAEYLPGDQTFPILRRLFPEVRSVLRADTQNVLPGPGGPFAPIICYEMLEADFVRRFVNLGARYIVNFANDGFCGATKEPRQHLAFAAFRAVENRRSVIRSTNSGISAFIDARGVIAPTSRTGLMERATLRGAIVPRDDRTFYGKWGDWLPRWLVSSCFLGLVGHALVRRFRKRWIEERTRQAERAPKTRFRPGCREVKKW